MKKLLTAIFYIAISTAVLTVTTIATGCTNKYVPKDKNYFALNMVSDTLYRVIELESETPERIEYYPLASVSQQNFIGSSVHLTSYYTYEDNCIFFKDSDAGKFTKKGIQEIYKMLNISGPKLEDSVKSCFTTDVSTFNKMKFVDNISISFKLFESPSTVGTLGRMDKYKFSYYDISANTGETVGEGTFDILVNVLTYIGVYSY